MSSERCFTRPRERWPSGVSTTRGTGVAVETTVGAMAGVGVPLVADVGSVVTEEEGVGEDSPLPPQAVRTSARLARGVRSRRNGDTSLLLRHPHPNAPPGALTPSRPASLIPLPALYPTLDPVRPPRPGEVHRLSPPHLLLPLHRAAAAAAEGEE